MTTIPRPRVPHHDHLEHPDWCAREMCQVVNDRDVIHAEVPEVFVTAAGHTLTIARVRDDELDDHGRQTTHPHDVRITDGTGTGVADLTLAEVPRFAAWVLARGRSAA